MSKEKDYVNVREFRRAARERWGYKKSDALARWKTMLQDPSVPKARDAEGWLTMPALVRVKFLPQCSVFIHRQISLY